jgi:geranylgeranyl transferase type-2 subunit beta
MYLQTLTTRLASGLATTPGAFRERHVAYLRKDQNADGGFSGREGESDLYYTAFALRSLAILNALAADVMDQSAGYLRQALTQQASVVDFFSLLYACFLLKAGGGPDPLTQAPPDWPERVAQTLESFRTSDGGYGKTQGAASGSTYHTFLVGLCYQLLGRAYPQAAEVLRFVTIRRRDDGGFVELAPMRRGGTNPTAAAVGALHLAGASPEHADLLRDVVAFFRTMQSPEGGLRANDRAPVADLLSTFTGLWSLDQLGALDQIDRSAARRYVEQLDRPTGGFHAGLWDDSTDVEYTFYGLGATGLLQ